MENIQTVENQPTSPTTESKTDSPKPKTRKKQLIFIAVAVVIVLILAGLYFAKGFIVAATVNGTPISRWSIIKELEAQGGKQALEAIIDKKVIEAELSKQNITVASEEVDAEINKIKEQVTSQGQVFEDALAAQGMTEKDLREQIETQKKLEKVLADKIVVSNEEVDASIKEDKSTAHEGETEEAFKEETRKKLEQEKFQTEAQKWVSELTAKATIKQYVNY